MDLRRLCNYAYAYLMQGRDTKGRRELDQILFEAHEIVRQSIFREAAYGESPEMELAQALPLMSMFQMPVAD